MNFKYTKLGNIRKRFKWPNCSCTQNKRYTFIIIYSNIIRYKVYLSEPYFLDEDVCSVDKYMLPSVSDVYLKI